jgi:hypothetical protein
MAISVDTVYQKVLALANKEQRGYITPQEFNLFANLAQLEIFEQYFYDLNIASRVPGNDSVYADVDDMLEEKLQAFESEDLEGVTQFYTKSLAGNAILPDYVYRVHRIEWEGFECEIQKTKDFKNAIKTGRLVAPTVRRPIANVRNKEVRVAIDSSGIFHPPMTVVYFRKPNKVNWTYVVVNKQAMYNNVSSTGNFELHPAEETNLVYKILKLAGVSAKQQDLLQAGQGMESVNRQQQQPNS